MPKITSTAIQRIEYDELSQRLQVIFATGNAYKYYDVPRSVYDRFLQASSKGTFFNQFIKDRYDFAQMVAM